MYDQSADTAMDMSVALNVSPFPGLVVREEEPNSRSAIWILETEWRYSYYKMHAHKTFRPHACNRVIQLSIARHGTT